MSVLTPSIVLTHRIRGRWLAALAAACFVAAFTGCVGDGPKAPDGAQHARCLPCVAEGDLPCIDVRVGATTPRAEWHGRTYYFRSDECRRAFLKDPRKRFPMKSWGPSLTVLIPSRPFGNTEE